MGGWKLLLMALTALLVAVGLAACGGGDDSSSTAEGTASTPAEGKSGEEASTQSDASGGGEKSKSGGEGGSASDEASEFVPKQHSDSGGGSAEFRTKGGDNSVQDFGDEAEGAEFDEAAAVVHNFLDARAEGNWAAACEYVSQTIVESIEKLAARAKQVKDADCATILEKLANPEAGRQLETEAREADVRSVRLEGERAFVLYTLSDGSPYSMPVTNEDGTWKVASVASYPLS